jgi:hypothetical protein
MNGIRRLYLAITTYTATQWLLVASGLTIIVGSVVIGGTGLAAQIAGILGFIFALLGIWGIGRPTESVRPLDEILEQLRAEVQVRLRREATKRRLLVFR